MDIQANKTKGLDIEITGKLAVLRFRDSALNFYVMGNLKDLIGGEIAKAFDKGCDRFVLSLANVEILDSSGISIVIVANNVLMQRQGKLYVTNLKPFILKIFDILRISKYLSIFETEAEAIEAAGVEA